MEKMISFGLGTNEISWRSRFNVNRLVSMNARGQTKIEIGTLDSGKRRPFQTQYVFRKDLTKLCARIARFM